MSSEVGQKVNEEVNVSGEWMDGIGRWLIVICISGIGE